jgi:hypothetical protein
MNFYTIVNGQQQGPFSLDELKEKGTQKDSLIWTEGMSDWQPAGDVSELKSIFDATPPPVPEKNNIPPTMPPLPEVNSVTEKELNSKNIVPIPPVSKPNPSNKKEQLPTKKKKMTVLKSSIFIGIVFAVIKLGVMAWKQIDKKESHLFSSENIIATTPAEVRKEVMVNGPMLEKAIQPYLKREDKKMKEEAATESGMEIEDLGIYAPSCSSTKKYIIGDLNNDGINDGIVLYEAYYGGQISMGGSAIFLIENGNLKLALMGLNNEIFNIEQSNSYPSSLTPQRIEDGIIHCIKYKYREDDPHCCPSIEIKEQYKLKNNKLVQIK